MLYKRIFAISLAIALLALLLCGCNRKATVNNEFSVKFISGDNVNTVLINLSDGKTILLDGGHTENSKNSIVNSLNDIKATQIDYYFLTSPNSNNVKNANLILDEYPIKTAYLPLVSNLDNFKEFNSLVETLNSSGAVINKIEVGYYILGENYFVCALSPNVNNIVEVNSASEISAISPTIYLEYYGVRFLFCGEIDKSVEENVVSNYYAGVYDMYFERAGKKVDIENIDFLHVPSQGNSNSCCAKFLDCVYPTNSIVSCISKTSNASIIGKLHNLNHKACVYTTDVNDISVIVGENSTYHIK